MFGVFCDACIANEHYKCPGRFWCYCQHRPIETVVVNDQANADDETDQTGTETDRYPDSQGEETPLLGEDV